MLTQVNGVSPTLAAVAHTAGCNYDPDYPCIDGPELPVCNDQRNTFLYCWPRM